MPSRIRFNGPPEPSRDDQKIRENRLRRAAQRQGLVLAKSARRDPNSLTFGTYMIVKPGVSKPVFAELETGHFYGKTLDQIEDFLTGKEAAT